MTGFSPKLFNSTQQERGLADFMELTDTFPRSPYSIWSTNGTMVAIVQQLDFSSFLFFCASPKWYFDELDLYSYNPIHYPGPTAKSRMDL